MNKIPTVFRRNPENRQLVLPEANPECEWVLAGEGTPTRKYDGTRRELRAGTYELIGPKINGNPEGVRGHELVRHAEAEAVDIPRDLDGIRSWLQAHPQWEGVVWHHPDGRRAKVKYRDFVFS